MILHSDKGAKMSCYVPKMLVCILGNIFYVILYHMGVCGHVGVHYDIHKCV